VALFAPLAFLCWPALRRIWAGNALHVAVPLSATALLLITGTLWMNRAEEGAAQQRFASLTTDLHADLRAAFAINLESVGEIERFFAASESVTREEFGVFVRTAIRRPGVQAIEWIPRVPHTERAQFESAMRNERFPTFRITRRDAQNRLVEADPTPEYFPVTYVEPLAGNEAAAGYDLGSNPTRREALQRARDTARPAATESIHLVQKQADDPGVLVFVPVYRPGFEPDGAGLELRRQSLRGFALSVLRVRALMQPLVAAATTHHFDFALSETTSDGNSRLLLGRPLPARQEHAPRRTLALEFAGREWRLDLQPTDVEWDPGNIWTGRALRLGSVLLALAIGVVVLSSAGQNAAVAALVAGRTRELAESEAKFRSITASASSAIVMIDQEARITFWNEAASRMLGWSTEEAVGRQIETLSVPARLQGAWRPAFEAFRGTDGRAVRRRSLELTAVRKGGEEFPIELSAATVWLEGRWHAVGIANEITERRRAAQAMHRTSERLALAIEGSGAGLWDWRLLTGEIDYNARWAEMLGYSIDELAPLNAATRDRLCHPEDMQEANRHLRKHLAGETPFYECTMRLRHKQGHWVWVLERGRVTERDPDGQPIRMTGTHLDVTEQKLASEELRRARDAADSANRAKSRFLANMSHEIRTPMNAILGFGRLLGRDSNLGPRQLHYLDTINRSGEHLLALINEILEMSKIEAGRTQLLESDFEIHGLIRDLEGLFVLRTEEKGLFLKFEVAPDVPPCLHADGGKIRQVLLNLLGNALKFTERGGIRVRVVSDPSSMVCIDVIDSGCGLAAEELPGVFEAFEQTQSGQQAGGTGLGLAISRQFARMMGGDVTVSSTPGQGSTFRFTFRATPAVPSQGEPSRTFTSKSSAGQAMPQTGEARVARC
jgi:PAS domain S-box-containing protein